MGEMTCGERVTRCIIGEKIDRVPFGVGLGWFTWKATLERWQKETGNPELDVAKELGFDCSWEGPNYIKYGYYPEFEEIVLEETPEFVVSRDRYGVKLRNRRDKGSMPEFLDYPVKTRADWERIREERLRPDDPRRTDIDWGGFFKRVRSTGEATIVGNYPYGVFGTPRNMMGVEEFLISFYTDPDLIHDIMNHITTVWLAVYERIAAKTQIDHIHIWEDMSGRQGSLLSPKMVEEFMMPCYDRISASAKRAGVRVMSVDTDGDCSELVPIFMKHGVNLIFPFEVQAGNDIREYRRKYPELGIMGGLDKRALAGTKEDIEPEIQKVRDMVKYGRYIPCFDHHIPPDVPWENFKYAALRIKDICYGG